MISKLYCKSIVQYKTKDPGLLPGGLPEARAHTLRREAPSPRMVAAPVLTVSLSLFLLFLLLWAIIIIIISYYYYYYHYYCCSRWGEAPRHARPAGDQGGDRQGRAPSTANLWTNYFCSDLISVDPICPQPNHVVVGKAESASAYDITCNIVSYTISY